MAISDECILTRYLLSDRCNIWVEADWSCRRLQEFRWWRYQTSCCCIFELALQLRVLQFSGEWSRTLFLHSDLLSGPRVRVKANPGTACLLHAVEFIECSSRMAPNVWWMPWRTDSWSPMVLHSQLMRSASTSQTPDLPLGKYFSRVLKILSLFL